MHSLSNQAQAEFLFSVIKYTPAKVNTRELAAALNLTVGATNMRMVRLRRKLAQSAAGANSAVKPDDLEFLMKVLEFSGGKTDLKGLAEEWGLRLSAASMRLTRLRKKFAQNVGVGAGAADSESGGEEVVPREEVKQEEGVIEVKCEGSW